jgi:hypothetical protein
MLLYLPLETVSLAAAIAFPRFDRRLRKLKAMEGDWEQMIDAESPFDKQLATGLEGIPTEYSKAWGRLGLLKMGRVAWIKV